MKKKILSLLLMLVMSLTLISPAVTYAAEAAPVEAEQAKFSQWVIPDLLYGDTYGVYPLTWYQNGVTGPIKKAQFYVLLAGLRHKILDTESATQISSIRPVMDSSITVEEALEAFYTVLSNYEYTLDLGFNSSNNPVDYMKLIGVYTGQNGELALDELCSVEQALVIATRIVTVLYNALDASSKGFLWEVKAGENTAYLLGSIHLASNAIYPLSQKMLAAFHSSDALVVEVDLYNQKDFEEANMLSVFTDGTTLKDHLSEEVYQKTVETAAKIGYTEEMISIMKPWLIYLLFEGFAISGSQEEQVTAAQLGIDMNFLNYAYTYQKPVKEIEGALYQYKVLDSFSEELIEYLIAADIEAIDDMLKGVNNDDTMESDELLDQWLEYWHEGDVEGFDNSYIEEDETDVFVEESEEEKKLAEEFMNKLFTQRDKGMGEYIDQLLKAEGSNTYFVVVGAGHYISDYSVLDLLKEKGYEINQIK